MYKTTKQAISEPTRDKITRFVCVGVCVRVCVCAAAIVSVYVSNPLGKPGTSF